MVNKQKKNKAFKNNQNADLLSTTQGSLNAVPGLSIAIAFHQGRQQKFLSILRKNELQFWSMPARGGRAKNQSSLILLSLVRDPPHTP